jgi:2-polyprenyl-6-methoxyphenol hydroxylase-like FAD-dependent oxidoreductase
MRTSCDILIVGGGPAGGLAALRLANAGLAVTLLEAQPVLGERVCGAYLCPAGVGLLDELGLRQHSLATAFAARHGARPPRQSQTRFPANTRPDFASRPPPRI